MTELLPIIGVFIPIFGILAGIIIPLSAFFWLYHEQKNKNYSLKVGLYNPLMF